MTNQEFPANEPTADIVIRALPASAEASSEQLANDIRKALRKWDI